MLDNCTPFTVESYNIFYRQEEILQRTCSLTSVVEVLHIINLIYSKFDAGYALMSGVFIITCYLFIKAEP